MTTPEQQRYRGEEAARLLENALLKEAFEAIEKNLHEKWATTKASDTQAREVFYMQVQCIKQVQRYLSHVITHGKQAAAEIIEKESKSNGTAARTV